MKKYWMSCRSFTIQVNVDSTDRIVFAAPIVRRFLGQNIFNLRYWMRGFGDFKMVSL